MCAKLLQSCPTLCNPMGFSRQEYLSGLPCPPSGDLPDPGIEPASLMSPALASSFFTTSATWEAPYTNMPKTKNERYIYLLSDTAKISKIYNAFYTL